MSAANKAFVGFVLTFLSALLVTLQDKTEFSDLTVLQWLVAVVSALVVAGGVYLTPNGPSPRNQDGQHGLGALVSLLVVVVFVVLIVLVLR